MAVWNNRIVGSGSKPASQFLANPLNFRRHPQNQRAAVKGSLDELGWVQNVLENVRTGNLIDGHERVWQALQNDDANVPFIQVDLSEEEERLALAILDPISALAETDKDQLDALLREVQTDDEALQKMLAELAKESGLYPDKPKAEDPGAQIDKAEELREKWSTCSGQLWEIPSLSVPGKAHRLLCGDSTKAEDVARLMGDEKAVLFATDPPYGIDYDSAQLHRNGSHYDAIEHDELKDEKYQAWLEVVFQAWLPHLAETAAWYLWHPMLTQGYFAAAAAAARVIISRQIIWVKPQFIFGRGEYHWMHELCFFGWRQGNRPPFYGEHNQTTVWALGYDGNRNDREHPTQKPAALFAIPMRNHARHGEICAEPFSGSGSQLIAGEQEGRLVYGMEISEKYVAVSLQRMSGMGLDPRLANA